MKKVLAIIVTATLVSALFCVPVSALSAQNMQDHGQIHFNIYKTPTPPVADGTINPGEYGDPIAVLNNGDPGVYWNGEGFDDILDIVLPKDMTFYATYDDSYFYVGTTYRDDNHYNPFSGPEVWQGDYLEFDFASNVTDDFDDMRDRARIAAGLGEELCIYSAGSQSNAANPWDGNEILDIGAVTRDEATKMTTYELRIPWERLTPDGKPPQRAYMYIQQGVAHSDYVDRSDYGGYLAVFRYAAYVPDLEDEVGGVAVFHVGTFAGDPPAPAEQQEAPQESGDAEAEEPVAPAQPATEALPEPASPAPTTGDNFAALVLVMLLCWPALVAFKKILNKSGAK
ncbi:MAG: hypothetical protein FWG34_11260 [Oscillospiraceae bacterium]|nr:hypothetical protein [Oscillospiraceae bacterium]